MFTDNYKVFKQMQFFNTSGKMIDVNNTSRTVSLQYCYTNDLGNGIKIANCRALDSTYIGVYFGSGTTPPQASDYRLEAPITTGLAITNGSNVFTVDKGNGTYEVSGSYIVRNTTDADITIAEIGYVAPMSNSSSAAYCMLLERQVLAVPVTVPAGEAKLITYKITFNQTFHVD